MISILHANWSTCNLHPLRKKTGTSMFISLLVLGLKLVDGYLQFQAVKVSKFRKDYVLLFISNLAGHVWILFVQIFCCVFGVNSVSSILILSFSQF